MKIEIKKLVHFDAYFHIFSIIRTGCLNTMRFHPHKIQSTKDKVLARYLKTTIINADILKHESKGEFFWDNFSTFFQKQCRKGEKHRSSHLKMFWEQGVLEISKQKEEENKQV